MTEISWLALVVVAAGSIAVYALHARRVRSGFYELFGPNQTVGLEEEESVVGAWAAERYFGPLVRDSERTLGSWASVLFWNAIPGRHWMTTQPALAFRGAPMWVRLTDRGRLVVTIARGWRHSLRPRVSYSTPARQGFEPLLASGPGRRAAVKTAAEAFPGKSLGHFNRPDRQFIHGDEPTELLVILPEPEAPLVVWCEPEAVAALKAWAAGR